MEYAVETNCLTKKFHHHVAVSQINMHVKRGEIYGLSAETEQENDLHENALRTVHADGRGDSAVWKTGSRNKSIYGADWKSD